MIQSPKLERQLIRYELSDHEWAIIKPMLPNRPFGVARNRVLRFFNKTTQCRRITTRYDKIAANYFAFIKLASIRIWRRAYASLP